MDRIRRIFHVVFAYGLLLTSFILLLELVVLGPMAFNFTTLPLINLCLILGILLSPVALVLCTTIPQFSEPVKELVMIDPKYPKWIAWVGKKVNNIDTLIYSIKCYLFETYNVYYVPFLQKYFFAMHSAMLLVCVLHASNRFDSEAFSVLIVGAMISTACTLVLTFLYHVSKKMTHQGELK